MLPTLICLVALVCLFAQRLLWTSVAVYAVIRKGLKRQEFSRYQRQNMYWRGWVAELLLATRKKQTQDNFVFYEQRVRELLVSVVRKEKLRLIP